ncbi:MAG: apolipoprotein N-acyltransferase, partial [Myxococcales bacterium]|nr:apolipoprotein N-acyltransferase [Myxococcales bacterium]
MKAAAALAVGVLLTVLAYPPAGVWPLAFLMLAPLAALVDRTRPRRAFVYTWLYSASMAALVVRWLWHALVVEYEVPQAPAALFIALLVGACAVIPSFAVALYASAGRGVGAGFAPLLFGALYVLAEWVRAEPLGLPWVLSGQALVAAPLWIQTAEWGGVHAPGLVAAVAGGGLGIALSRRDARALVAPAALLVLAGAFGAQRLSVPRDEGPPVRVGVVQSSVPQGEKSRGDSALRNLERHASSTWQLASRGDLDLIVWSETAVEADLDETPGLAAALRAIAAGSDALLLTGAPRSRAGRRTNAAVSFDARGLRTSYDRQRLVPFSEFEAERFGFVAPLLGPVTAGEPYARGELATVFDGLAVPFGTPISFEITDPELVREFRTAGAELLVNLSNDARFGRTGYAEMHLGHAVLRAVELRTWVVRGANTGISAVIDPAGRVRERLGVFELGTLESIVFGAGPATLYV